ncbi:MAG: V-type ATP synthase subunit D [Alkalibacterium sp.]|uniref:V-type ATP synthase subunit D n=1 Tax=Alkalibacterium gilvum TaxID=1130080 RepID=A0A1H6V5Q0_9LACT|nr:MULTISPECIES: V-type ATP synthase subunit D [Alkalibacterium]MDN6294303.1 V-type ATP synthase subunit D [Alkalibacterium sp.]MDN6295533.1 V-type ATP synthase subunit D [Alkalibacterium sp.]MDN6326404.1 V-type ATP synthase subunit D [Alkalibacterium sp.]MDN6385745.1 V-type ATP synthase subunit D [Alkalibacterium sp.]MDN6398030.1 V-type ATP synthase subunit D [Alkalibacterium sp.]
MVDDTTPTKGNLMQITKSLKLSNQGYSLMDRKRVILVNEIMSLVDKANDIQKEIDQTFKEAYAALEKANIESGIHYVQEIAATVPVEDSINIKVRSIMGTEIPKVEFEKNKTKPAYAFYSTSTSLDEARLAFEKVKELTIKLSEIENSAYRLANNIKKTQKRANALENISIPRLKAAKKEIENALEEKEREEFTRLKVVKENIKK